MQSQQNLSVGCAPVAAWRVEGIWETKACWAPSVEDPCKDRLLRIVGDMRSGAVEDTAKVTVGAHDDIGGGHVGFQRQQDCGN
jgi:hypothetical protein